MKKSILLTVILSGSAFGSITYIDATAANTADSSNSAASFTGWTARGAAISGDASNFGNGGGVWQGPNTNDPASLEQVTSVVVTNGVYNVYAFFWDDNALTEANSWDIDAGLSSGVLGSYRGTSPEVFVVSAASQANPSTQVDGLNVLGQGTDDYSDYEDGNRFLYVASIGQAVVTDGTLKVYINDSDLNSNQRTWYDGVGYEAVPEPSSALLGGLALLGLLGRRR